MTPCIRCRTVSVPVQRRVKGTISATRIVARPWTKMADGQVRTKKAKKAKRGKGKAEGVSIPEPSMLYIEADLAGIEPGMLFNPFNAEAREQLLSSMNPEKAKLSRGKKDPEAEYETRLAALSIPGVPGCLAMNVLAFKQAMTRGAKSVDKVPMTLLRSSVFVEPDSMLDGVPAAHIKGDPVRDTRAARNTNGSMDIRTRVLLPRWTYTLRFTLDTSALSVERALTCLVNAGVGTGVGDYRPERNGLFGRWDVEDCRAQKIVAKKG